MQRDTIRQWVNVLAVVATIAANALANIVPFNGRTTAAVSDKFQVYFVPAGYVFAIWGLIYVALVAFAVYQALPAQRQNPRLRGVGYLFAMSCLANIVWLLCWHYELFPLTVVLMLMLLVLLIAVYLRLGTGRTAVSAAETWCVRIPFSIYLGWITVATVANVTDLLYYLKWDGFGIGPVTWAVIMLVIGFCIAVAMSVTRGDIAYLLVILWAYAGIAIKQAATPAVANAAWVMAALAAVMLVAGPLLRKRLWPA